MNGKLGQLQSPDAAVHRLSEMVFNSQIRMVFNYFSIFIRIET